MSEQTMHYIVAIVRVDKEEPIVLSRTDNFDEAKELWIKTHQEWTSAVAERRPFILEEPFLTAFEPSLIREVVVAPKTVTKDTHDNPYKKSMQRTGLTAALQNNTFQSGSDILDGGYS